MIKKNPSYRVTVYTQFETHTIEYPITCKFNSSRGLFSQANKCTIDLFNLNATSRAAIFKDALTLDKANWKYIKLEAGWNGTLSQIFFGKILQGWSSKDGGQVDVITHIECQPFDIFETQSSHTFEAGTSYKEAYKTIASDFPNVQFGNLGTLEGSFKTQTTCEGNTLECLNALTGGYSYVDNGVLNTIMANEVLDVPVPLLTDENGLLSTPVRRDASLTVKMLFEPSLVVGQLLEIKSKIQPIYNGQYKVLGFTHDCLISPTQAGQRITTVDLWIAPLLTSTNINVTGEAITGGASEVNSFNKVKGEQVTVASQKEPNGVREVYLYIQKNNKAPHTNITKNIYWDEVIKPNSLAYGKPTLAELTNLYNTAYRIQIFVDRYYPGSKVQINSGWRSRGYNNTLKNADANSEHLYGNAIDFAIIGANLNTVYNQFVTYWKGRKYKHSSFGFIHADTTTSRGVYANDW
ncbi:MAG: DUF882 domain-containing protein [Clostridia bacterium]|nr:DUF882 domain-containing protein [Clostridia bacterium]